MLTKIQEAMDRYFVRGWRVYDSEHPLYDGTLCDNEAAARQECRRLNALTALDVMRDVPKAALNVVYPDGTRMRAVMQATLREQWAALIDAIKEGK